MVMNRTFLKDTLREIRKSPGRFLAIVAIIALGTEANPLVQSTTPDLKTNRRGYISADPETLRTSKKGVFAGGDIVTGGATVILAMGAGRKAAASINEYLKTGEWDAPASS